MNAHLVSILLALAVAVRAEAPPILFSKNFESGSMGRVEVLGETAFRIHAEGQQDEHGRNRQPTWYYFRLEQLAGREVTLTLTDFLGEYNGQPACAMSGELLPVYSTDGEHWQHFAAGEWDDAKKELTVQLPSGADSISVAHIQPYPHSRLLALLAELAPRACVRSEVIGQSLQGRPLALLTVTDFQTADSVKHCVWLQARQHAWEAGTSFAMEGALRFITSDEPAARALREKCIFKFMPMGDPDGVVLGRVRFNGNGFDVNRHWGEVDLRDPSLLRLMPELWYEKKAILAAHWQKPIDLLLNLHNTETAEYLDTAVDEEAALAPFVKLFRQLSDASVFDPSRVPATGPALAATGSTNVLWPEARVPVALMELRIGPSKKLHRRPTAEDRLQFGRELIAAMAAAVE